MMKSLHRTQGGFTLLEVMITAVIMVAALLAISGLQSTAANVEYEAYQRARAIVVAEEMVSRLSSNRVYASDYVTGTSAYWGTGDSQPASCSSIAVTRDRDICEWSNMLKGNSVTDAGGNAAPGMRKAIGCVVRSTVADEYFVVVAWQGQTQQNTTLPSACGSGVYGNDAYRRVVVRAVRFAQLGNLVEPVISP